MPIDPIPRRSKLRHRVVLLPSLLSALLCFCVPVAAAQTPAPPYEHASAALPDAPQPQVANASPGFQTDAVTLRELPHNFLRDQQAIWTGPTQLRPHDLEWLAPLTLATGAAIANDHRTMHQVVSQDAGFNNANVTTSDVLVGGFIAVPVVLFASGHFAQNDHAREAGILGSEALADGLVAQQVLKLAFWRERPYVDSSRGRFFQSSAGLNSSFPSAHSTLAWSAASAIAGEYHSPWVQTAAYTGATAVSLTRVLGRKHFPSDVLVGGSLGWLIGHYVVEKHQRPLKTLIAHHRPPTADH